MTVDGQLAQMVRHLRSQMERYGFAAFAERERVEAYLGRHFPREAENTAACIAVLYLPRYLDCLKWLRFSPQTQPLAMQYWNYYEACIAEMEGDRQKLHEVNRLFLLD